MLKIINGTADVVLFLLMTVPLLLWLIAWPFCEPMIDEASAGDCAISLFQPIQDFLYTFILFLGFGGFIVYVPIVLFFLLIAVICKVLLYRRGNLLGSPRRVLQFWVSLVPFALLFYFFFI